MRKELRDGHRWLCIVPAGKLPLDSKFPNDLQNVHIHTQSPLGVIFDDESWLTIKIHNNGFRAYLKDSEDGFTWLASEL